MEEKKGVGRPSGYNYDMCLEICTKVSEGKNIKKVLSEKEEYPSFQTWCDWKRTYKELSYLYTRSIQDKSESMDEAIDDVMILVKNGEIESHAARVLIDTLKWKASKYYPKMFGDKVEADVVIRKVGKALADEEYED